jgi:hypothetical protein
LPVMRSKTRARTSSGRSRRSAIWRRSGASVSSLSPVSSPSAARQHAQNGSEPWRVGDEAAVQGPPWSRNLWIWRRAGREREGAGAGAVTLSPTTVTQNTRCISRLGSAIGKMFNTHFCFLQQQHPKKNHLCK